MQIRGSVSYSTYTEQGTIRILYEHDAVREKFRARQRTE